jgi:hypothetical protein
MPINDIIQVWQGANNEKNPDPRTAYISAIEPRGIL